MADTSQFALTEQIVREVLRRLTGLNRSVAQDSDSNRVGDLILPGRLVTLEVLEQRMDGVRRIIVPERALITPAARDELRQRKIEIVFGDQAVAGVNGNSGPAKLLVATTPHASAPAAIAAIEAVASVDMLESNSLPDAASQIGRTIVGQKRLGIMLTDRPAAAACIANRHAGVRAAIGENPASVTQAVLQVAANLLVVDSSRQNPFQLKATVREFARGGWRECPREFEGAL